MSADGSPCLHKLSKVGRRRDISRYSCTVVDVPRPATLTVNLDAMCRRNNGAVRHSGQRSALWQQPTWCWCRPTVRACNCEANRNAPHALCLSYMLCASIGLHSRWQCKPCCVIMQHCVTVAAGEHTQNANMLNYTPPIPAWAQRCLVVLIALISRSTSQGTLTVAACGSAHTHAMPLLN